ncbi:mitochondrial glycine transporter B-like isoform X2 [Lineus longissimus]|uniref:mitochondrial glycine transporter B-like isoform X2 n=1 Tax=Lineus longissimus TaxID=88925 RepID=UPI002B4F2CB1
MIQKESRKGNRCEKIMEGILSNPLMKSFIAGSFSGTCSTILFQPLDLVKTKLQAPVSIGASPLGIVTTVTNVVRNEKILGLWRGMAPSISRTVPGVGMYFCSLHWLKTNFGSSDPHALESMFLGALARSLSGVSMLPVTVVKTRFESGYFQYRSVLHALSDIYRSEGAKGLYSGLAATLLRDAPFSGLYLMFYTQLKKATKNNGYLQPSNPFVHFSCGCVAGSLASIVTQPADVIKTHMQLYPGKYKNARTVIIHIYGKEGAVGFLRGIIPRCVRRTLMAAMAWTVYEQIMTGVGLK